MCSFSSRQKGLTVIILSAILLLGAAVRLYDLTWRTMTHIEIYVPGIELPPDLSRPQPRLSVRQTLVSLLVEREPHPPGYYLLMLGWTKMLGSGILSLRLPSALLGAVSILLVCIVGALEKNRVAAILAAGMLALNGWHILWSQLAKGYVVACFLGLLSTVLLALASKVAPDDFSSTLSIRVSP